MTKPTTTLERDQKSFADLFPSMDPAHAASLPVEVVREIEDLASRARREPTILIEMATPAEALKYGQELVAASIAKTFPEDWVIFKSKDGHELGYLQDVGCERIVGLWGISFDGIDRQRHVTETKVPAEDGDEDVAFEVLVSGYCERTRQKLTEIGFRASSGFFERNWKSNRHRAIERIRVKADILKSAIANGQGRLIRSFAGMGQMPIARLLDTPGFERKRLRGAHFESGTKGGSGSGAGASEPQIQAILKGAYDFGKVALLGTVLGRDAVEKLIRDAGLTGGREGTASALIERMGKTAKGGMTIADFGQALGVEIGNPEPGSEG